MSTHNYENPSEAQDLGHVEAQVTKGKKYYDEQGWEISPPISDRECIYRCLENCEELAGLDRKQVRRLMEDFETMKTEFVRNEEYPVLQEVNVDLQKITSTGTAVAVIGGGTFMGGNYAVDQATGGPEKRIKAKQTELQLIVREEVRSALADMLPKSTGGVVRTTNPGDYREEVPK